ncbi:PAS domain S-box-containing protein [Azospirillum fermentarium]|uniref:PAS domain S-box protein n=1 Tax=Azospirillum fermentarium TaxID=1233114 RepID=UPI0022267609|nr:PAS domain S-box protein [Azospirillum fermentarium]MCW2248072.1 PAS domain S-box-containing protein [Azospirillum fermentarium]
MHKALTPTLPPDALPGMAADDALLLVQWVADGRACPITAASPAAAALVGVGGGMGALLHPGDRARFLAEIQGAASAGRRQVCHHHHRILDRQGRERWWQTVTTLSSHAGGVVTCASHAFDITGEGVEPALGDPLFRALLDSIPDLIFIKDHNSIYMGCNRAFAGCFGVDVAWVVGRSDYDLVPGNRELAAFFRSHDRAMLAEGRPRRFEEWVTAADGRVILLETLKTPFFGPSGEVLGIIGVSHDITAAAKDRDALRESEERVRLLLHSTRDGILGLDGEGVCTLANPASARLLGYGSSADLIGQPLTGLAQGLAGGLNGSLQDETVWRNDGSSFAADIRSAPVMRDGERIGAVIRITDVTERRRNQEHLRVLSQALDQSRLGVVIADAHGQVSYVNPRAAEMTGLAREEVVRLDGFLSALLPPAWEGTVRLWRAVLAGETWEDELTLRTPGGVAARVLLRAFPVRGGDGTIANLLCLAEDVTDRHQAEEHIRRAQKMQAVGVLAGGIAHDFNNILLVITGYAHLVLDRLSGGSDLREDVEQIIDATRRAQDLVGQLLTFSRQDMAEMQVIDLRRTVEEAVKLASAAIPSTIHLRTVSGAGPMTVLAAPNQIHQMMLNLCKNAADAIGEARRDGGTIIVSMTHVSVGQPQPLSRATLEPGRYICLTVADSGCGIPAAVQERMFEPFFTTKPVGKGTGLGLAAVHGIAGRHGGVIDVVSSPALGTSISLYLPFYDAGLSWGGGRAARVLLVGGTEGARALAAHLLRSQGLRVVATGSERRGRALFAMAPHRFAAVILPAATPGAGWKTLTMARSLAASSGDIPIILCNAQECQEKTLIGNEAAAAGITIAPSDPSAFMALVARIIGTRRSANRGGEPGARDKDGASLSVRHSEKG